ncbi:receptor-like protein 33 isoform X2 [Quercus robur]|uniref:receptor-like protein 33 isoform X2 n=1 Tax=Quercus robur TaxID=38942 RepID=UPI00216223EA|nr:receptor-like protein 33 isoform X2 [Quercus robur]
MGRSTWKYQVFFLFSLILHSQLPFPSSLSSSLSSMPSCSALLHFNKSFSLKKSASVYDPSYPKTASWQEDKHCCTWDGVECDKNKSHVVGLDLTSSWLLGHIHSNSTLFFLPNLRRLNLADNNFDGSLIPSESGNFKSLTYLNLSFSVFSGQIPFEISQLSSLVSLDLSKNGLLLIEAPVWKRVIGNLTQLRELILDTTNMSSIRPNSLMNLSSSLTTLSLRYCDLRGKLENNVLCLPSIQTLDLVGNSNLEGSLLKPNWSCSSLKFLGLSGRMVSREFLNSIGNLKSLERLELSSANFLGELPSSIGNLKSLERLELSSANFSGELPSFIGNLKSLEYLDLFWTSLSRELPSFIGNLKFLKHLTLRDCNITGSIPAWLGNLTKLTYLDLSNNSFYGLLPSSLFNLPNLSTLDLDNNQLVGPLPSHVSGLNLVDLDLSSNFLNGTLPSWLFRMPSLETLYLYHNQFVGDIGEFKYNSLKDLNLGYNKLHGSIPRSVYRLVNLTSLYLSSNNLSIMLGSEMFSKLENLKYLDLSYNLVSINNNVAYALPNLLELNLSSSNISEFPIFLRLTIDLQSLDFSNNKIYGRFPKWLGDVGMNSLYYVNLRGNLLQGPFPTLNFSSLQFMFFSNNKFIGEIPSFICDAIYLRVLDLSHNNLSGMIPKCLVNSTALSVLDLRMNSLHGTIPAIFAKGNNFRNINLNGNQLEGQLPQSLGNCKNLEVLDLGNNKINGAFPYWLGSLQKLQVLVIRSNRFQGRIGNPKTKFPFPNLRIIDISNNQFNGPLPITYFEYLKAMMNVDESGVASKYMGEDYYQDSLNIMMKGQFIEMERVLTILTSIDFSYNSFTGEMPKIIGRLKSLKGLNLSYNNLIGYIPSSIGNLTNLEWLDLSFNKLGGEIPSQLVDLTSLAVLNLSHNQLTGHIPSGNQFNTFNNDSYTDNLGLCGFPLSKTCDNHEAKQPPPPTLQQDENLEHENGFGWQAVSIGYACGTIFGMFMGYLMFKIGKPKCLVRMVKLEQHIMLRRLKKNAHKCGGRR